MYCFLVLLVLAIAATISTATVSEDSLDLKFAIDLYTASLETHDPERNIVISPFSVQIALGLLLMGANGTTAEQIAKGLNLNSRDRTIIASHFHEIINRFDSGDTLKIANKIYINFDLELNPDFSKIAEDQFGSGAETVNFGERQDAADTINEWVQNKTNGLITEFIPADSLNAECRLVLVNAIHFKAAWQHPFSKYRTSKRDFWTSETDVVQVDTMSDDINVLHGQIEALDAHLVMIPYKNSPLSMAIFLPNSRTGLQEMEGKLRDFFSEKQDYNLKRQEVTMFLPKFEFLFDLDLKKILEGMGIKDMFTDWASLPFLASSYAPLKVDKVLHRAYISVHEEDTEAAAATGVKISMSSMAINPVTIKIDHPFLFAIMEKNNIIFIGSVRSVEF